MKTPLKVTEQTRCCIISAHDRLKRTRLIQEMINSNLICAEYIYKTTNNRTIFTCTG